IDAEFAEQGLVIAEKRRGIQPPIVPHQNDESAWAKDASEFPSRLLSVEPVEGLAGDDEVHAAVGQSCALCRATHAVKARIARKLLLSRKAHFAVGFDGKDCVAVIQEKLRRDARA